MVALWLNHQAARLQKRSFTDSEIRGYLCFLIGGLQWNLWVLAVGAGCTSRHPQPTG